MGGFEKWRNFLLNLFPLCFRAALARGTTFDLCIVDLMQYLTGAVVAQRHGSGFDAQAVTQRVARAVGLHQNNEEDPTRPLLAVGLVCLLDTVQHVPKNKAAKQRQRDASGDAPTHMTAALYEALVAEKGAPPPLGLFIRCGGGETTTTTTTTERYAQLSGQTVWRSVNLKLQLYRAVTRQVMEAPVKEGKMLLLDDGLDFSTQDLERVRAEMAAAHDFEARSAFEQECLVAQLMTHSSAFFQRFMVGADRRVARFGKTAVGEADIKVQAYISPRLGVTRFLAVNQDTDVLFILLLHMRSLLHGDERDDALEVWLDMRSPGDKAESRPYRFVDVKRLYCAIVALFRQEFPAIEFPVETLCLLVFSLETDYTRKFHACLGIGERAVWDAFSELHHDHQAEEGHLCFVDKGTGEAGRVRRKARKFSPDCTDMLASAVRYDDEARRFVLDHGAISRFYYLLIQQSLARVRHDLALCCTGAEMHPLPAEELRIYARDIAERVRAHRRDGASQTTLDAFFRVAAEKRILTTDVVPVQQARKKQKPVIRAEPGVWTSSRNNKERKTDVCELLDGIVEVSLCESRPCCPEEEEEEEEEEASIISSSGSSTGSKDHLEMACYLTQHAAVLARVARIAGEDEFFGVPSPHAMLARIYRVEWYLAQCRDGWKANPARGTPDCVERAPSDPSLSMWGWRERPLEGDEAAQLDALNSTYTLAKWDETKRGFTPWHIEETDEVSHRRYY